MTSNNMEPKGRNAACQHCGVSVPHDESRGDHRWPHCGPKVFTGDEYFCVACDAILKDKVVALPIGAPRWISNDPTKDCYARTIFGMMLELAKMQNYHSDLYHDALCLHRVDKFQTGTEIIWASFRSGTHICIDPDGFPADFVPAWHTHSVKEGAGSGWVTRTYRFKVELKGSIPHWFTYQFGGE